MGLNLVPRHLLLHSKVSDKPQVQYMYNLRGSSFAVWDPKNGQCGCRSSMSVFCLIPDI